MSERELRSSTVDYVAAMRRGDGYASARDNAGPTCYGTCYALLTRFYLGTPEPPTQATAELLASWQDDTGYIYGPELRDWTPPADASHDHEHLVLHSTCSALPVFNQWGLPLKPLAAAAEKFLDPDKLQVWLDQRDLVRHAWYEGNNLLFAGQLLVHLRDVEHRPGADAALGLWFDWLDTRVDRATGLWGTQHGAPVHHALYGGYHQLLVYFHEKRPVPYPERLVDAVLSIQGPDGGFNPQGNSGACEDVDAVDVLVNLYKRYDYRRADIRVALRLCLKHLDRIKNPDGGFPYAAKADYVHMGMPATFQHERESSMFPTWFRVHTLALIGEVLTDEPELPRAFNRWLSMGWHEPWDREARRLSPTERRAEAWALRQVQARNVCRNGRRQAARLKRWLGRRAGRLKRALP